MRASNLVSIVLPVYNGEQYIDKAVESIIGQNYKNWELILVNDCSTDRTLEILEKYSGKDGRIRIINNAHNMKLPASLNIGFENAKGSYLTWTSDDNIYEENALETMCKVLDSNPDIGMVYADFDGIDGEGNKAKRYCMHEPDDIFLINCVGACFLYRAEVKDKIGNYNPDKFLVEDYDYWLRIYSRFRMKHICESLYMYRFHEASLTSTRQEQIMERTYALKKEYLSCATEKLDKKRLYLFYDSIIDYYGNRRSVMDYTGYDRGYWNHYIWKVIRDCLIKIKVKLFEKK